MFNCVSCERFFVVHAFDRARAKLTVRKLLGLRRPYFFFVDVSPSSEFRRWPNHYGCVGPHLESSASGLAAYYYYNYYLLRLLILIILCTFCRLLGGFCAVLCSSSLSLCCCGRRLNATTFGLGTHWIIVLLVPRLCLFFCTENHLFVLLVC